MAENTPQLRADALHLQLELELHCYCHALSTISRPCDSCRAAGMIGRLLKVLAVDAEVSQVTASGRERL